MDNKRKWIYGVIVTVLVALAGYAAARDNKLTETTTRVDQIEKREVTAKQDRKEIKKAQQETNERLAAIQTMLKALAAKEGIRYD